MQLKKAKEIALDIWGKMKDLCEPGHCKITGSIRREKPEVKDIEICALPKTVEIKDLFGNITGRARPKEWVELVYSLGNGVKGNPNGKYMQIELREHPVKLDLFMPGEEDFWRQVVIRTGSADWVKTYVSGGWVRIGWCGTKDEGLMLQSQCKRHTLPNGHSIWVPNVPASQKTKPPAWRTEHDFFEWLHLPFVHPNKREI
jgi:DNA polymerase/3'-5' exonuclease PolX